MMHRIDEIVPADPLHAEVVLHVRRLARARIRKKERDAGSSLALLFGCAHSPDWDRACNSADPLQSGAAIAARVRGLHDGVVPLGHDEAHIAQCHVFLRERKHLDDAFDSTIASDLATLLELSKARELAIAEGLADDGSRRPLPILIRGQTGTGKELLAHSLHMLGARHRRKKDAPYAVIHVAGMTEDMINAELFGHVRGAFTDAKKDRIGRLAEADGGTVLIDEVGDLPMAAQLRLLRFLQTQRLSRIGDNRETKIDVRVIAATWHDLDEDVKKGSFRQDLLYRLRVGTELLLPPLSARPGVFQEVLPELLRRRGHAAEPLIARSAVDALVAYHWPGNLRELVGVIEQSLNVAEGATIRVEHLPPQLQRNYLTRPLYVRATAFLMDEADGQGVDREHVAWRASEIERSLESLPAPEARPEIATVSRFLSLLDDSSVEHRDAVARIHSFGELDREYRRQETIMGLWTTVLTDTLSPDVRAEVALRRDASSRRLEQLKDAFVQAQVGLRLDQHPWFALLDEVVKTPLFAQVDRNSLVTSFLAIFNVVKAIAPRAVEDARETVKAGGLPALRDRVLGALREGDSHDSYALPRPPGSLTREEWQELARKYPTQASAVDATGYDPKTIAKYFKQHNIANPWRRGE